MLRSIPEGPVLAPSILSADFARLGEAMAAVERAGAGLLHLDVMDGHFVPNLTIGPPVVASLRRASILPFDVHLMIEDPGRWAEAYVQAGADMISVHAEADRHLHRTVQWLRGRGVRAGVALNPATPISAVEDLLPELDHVLVMSVNPGFAAQQFIAAAREKLSRLREAIDRRGLATRLEVDGGVKRSNAADLVRAGADILVAGSAVYDAADPEAAARDLIASIAAGVAR
jgi:ribulose-phosphate 3-epimerase